jgi:hypothetical protein
VQKQNTINLAIEYVTPGQSHQLKKSINHKLLKLKTKVAVSASAARRKSKIKSFME